MPQIDNHLKWCLSDTKRLIKSAPDLQLAQKHLKKSEYNYNVLQTLEELKIYDWALNVGFYAIYHCFLGILSKYGYSSKNQSCTITAILKLIEDKKLDFDKDLVLQFDTLDVEDIEIPSNSVTLESEISNRHSRTKGDTINGNVYNLNNPTTRQDREMSTYGVETSIDLKQLNKVKELILKVQRETIKVLVK